MKKVFCLFLCAVLIIVCAVPAFAAGRKSLVYCENSTLKASFAAYQDITVRSGITLTIDKSSGFEIYGKVTVEPGGKIVCNGVGNGQFNFTLQRGSDVTGMTLYYQQRNSDGSITIEPIPVPIGETWSMPDGPWSQMCPSFKWNSSVQGFCLTWAMAGNPFHVKTYHSERDMDTAEQYADMLHKLGLFKGIGTSKDGTPIYDLARPATRLEALVMLIRLLGKEDDAQAGSWSHPFTDVPEWGSKYVGYAYENGLTMGISSTEFGMSSATAQQYMTFILRALGYTDEDSDSTLYIEAMEHADRLGLLKSSEDAFEICESKFWRADVVAASWRALFTPMKDGRPLYVKLIEEGVFSADALFPPQV